MDNSNSDAAGRDYRTENCELCIVGAGIAGLNALFVASQYLSKQDRVILIDKNPTFGGMWNETYDYVRLHQPHRMFTAGNIEWTAGREPSYLASKREVLDHFEDCIKLLRSRVTLIEHYGCRYESHSEEPIAGGQEARVLCTSPGNGTGSLLIKARKCIKAFGFQVPKNEALPVSSSAVNSISPEHHDFAGEAMNNSDAPVYIIGGGKTAMDTAHLLLKRFPERKINLVVGKGTVFFCRNKAFPTGLKRWVGGKTSAEAFLDLALKFDGDNEAEVFDYFKKTYAVCLDDRFEQYLFGILSEEENATIADGVESVLREYMTDVADVEGQATMLFRSGNRLPIEAGSWIVNCTGYIMRDESEYEPYLSEKGTVASVQPTSGIHFLSTFSAYFLVHLLFLGKLDTLPLYEVNYAEVKQKDRTLLPFLSITQTLYNIMLIIDAVPFSVMNDCGLDFDRWYPAHRRLIAGMKLTHHKRNSAGSLRAALDRARARHGITCGPLKQV